MGGREASQPTQRQPTLQAAEHKGPLVGAEPGGWAFARSAASPLRPARRAPRARSCHRAPRSGTPRAGGGSGRTPGAPRTAALPGLHRSRGDPAPPGIRLRLCPGTPSAAAAAGVAGAGPVLTCAPSAEQSAESGGASARHPRGGPCSGGGSLHCLGRQGEGASLCCLFMRPPQRLGIGRQEDVPAPAPRTLTPDAVAPRPSAPTAPPPLYGGRVAGLGPAPIRGPGTPPETSCPAAPLTTGLLRQHFYGEETVFASRPRISLVLVWGKEGKLEAAGCSMWKRYDSAMTLVGPWKGAVQKVSSSPSLREEVENNC